jgi:prepilin-type N-terminal cleavage/methylation domain-containing protein
MRKPYIHYYFRHSKFKFFSVSFPLSIFLYDDYIKFGVKVVDNDLEKSSTLRTTLLRLKEKGFTLIELMIVVAILATLAAIAIPKFTLMVEKSREGATKGNLGSIRSAASLYYGNNSGLWPTTLASTSTFSFSPYLSDVPAVEVTGVFINGAPSPAGTNVAYASYGVVPTSALSGWLYDSSVGHIFVNSTVQDSQAIAFSYYGFE